MCRLWSKFQTCFSGSRSQMIANFVVLVKFENWESALWRKLSSLAWRHYSQNDAFTYCAAESPKSIKSDKIENEKHKRGKGSALPAVRKRIRSDELREKSLGNAKVYLQEMQPYIHVKPQEQGVLRGGAPAGHQDLLFRCKWAWCGCPVWHEQEQCRAMDKKTK